MITLLDILSYRDNKLTDLEIWAVSRECCIALKSVYNSPTMFQTLCITPDTVGFNIDGSVCFLDLGKGEFIVSLFLSLCACVCRGGRVMRSKISLLWFLALTEIVVTSMLELLTE